MTTIARVAREAGVGVGTVSRVINGSEAVSEATRRRVLDVVAELGYSIGVVAPFFTRSSVIERLRGVAPMLAAAGYQLILFDVESPAQRHSAFKSVIGRVATPDSIAAFATAGASCTSRRGSNGCGIR